MIGALIHSAHSLQIQKSRYHRLQKFTIEERFFLHCTAGDVEDEMHFVMKCLSLAEKRGALIMDTYAAFLSFLNLQKNDQYIFYYESK